MSSTSHRKAVELFLRTLTEADAPAAHTPHVHQMTWTNKEVAARQTKRYKEQTERLCPDLMENMATPEQKLMLSLQSWRTLSSWQVFMLLTYPEQYYFSIPPPQEGKKSHIHKQDKIETFCAYLRKCSELIPTSDRPKHQLIDEVTEHIRNVPDSAQQTTANTLWEIPNRGILHCMFPYNMQRMYKGCGLTEADYRTRIWPSLCDIGQEITRETRANPAAKRAAAQNFKVKLWQQKLTERYHQSMPPDNTVYFYIYHSDILFHAILNDFNSKTHVLRAQPLYVPAAEAGGYAAEDGGYAAEDGGPAEAGGYAAAAEDGGYAVAAEDGGPAAYDGMPDGDASDASSTTAEARMLSDEPFPDVVGSMPSNDTAWLDEIDFSL
jgi:hypothetical protein